MHYFVERHAFVSTLRFSVSYPSINKHASNACFFVLMFFSSPNNKGLLEITDSIIQDNFTVFSVHSAELFCKKLKLITLLSGRIKRLLFPARVDTEKFNSEPFVVDELVSCLKSAKSVEIAAATRVSYIGAPETELRA